MYKCPCCGSDNVLTFHTATVVIDFQGSVGIDCYDNWPTHVACDDCGEGTDIVEDWMVE